ncbi:unnamed protein product [Trichobilharzia szidati]|nr:unnamed protein product [Trichobilharzia szidati]
MLLSFSAGNVIFFRDIEEESKTIEPGDIEKLNQSEISRLNTLISPWHSQGVLPPPIVWDSQFATWSADPAGLSSSSSAAGAGASCQGNSLSNNNNNSVTVPGSIVGTVGGADTLNQYGYYGPYLPQSHESTSTASTSYPFSSTYKSREQPLRIYTAEDIPSPVSSSNNTTHHKITGDNKHASTGPSSPKCTRSRDSRTP